MRVPYRLGLAARMAEARELVDARRFADTVEAEFLRGGMCAVKRLVRGWIFAAYNWRTVYNGEEDWQERWNSCILRAEIALRFLHAVRSSR